MPDILALVGFLVFAAIAMAFIHRYFGAAITSRSHSQPDHSSDGGSLADNVGWAAMGGDLGSDGGSGSDHCDAGGDCGGGGDGGGGH